MLKMKDVVCGRALSALIYAVLGAALVGALFYARDFFEWLGIDKNYGQNVGVAAAIVAAIMIILAPLRLMRTRCPACTRHLGFNSLSWLFGNCRYCPKCGLPTNTLVSPPKGRPAHVDTIISEIGPPNRKEKRGRDELFFWKKQLQDRTEVMRAVVDSRGMIKHYYASIVKTLDRDFEY